MSSPFECSWIDRQLYEHQHKAFSTIKDICTIARNLGFETKPFNNDDLPYRYGEKAYIYLKNGDIFMEYKTYKNGNMHVKFNQEFTKAMNVEVSRLLGWIRSREDIKKEFPQEMARGAEKYFKQNYTCIGENSLLMISTAKKFEFTQDETKKAITIQENYKNCLETVLKTIDNFNGIITPDQDKLNQCLKILETQQGFIYRQCLITKQENQTKIEFKELNDYNKYLKEVA
jgi:hypothetical protein